MRPWIVCQVLTLFACIVAPLFATPPAQDEKKEPDKKKEFGIKGFGPGGFGGPFGQQRKLVKQFDKNNDGWLNSEERLAARTFLTKEREEKGGFGFGFGKKGKGPGGFGKGMGDGPPKPGPHVSPAEAASFPKASLYEPTVLRTLFLEFDSKDWEAELEIFHGTDVEVPAALIVDGKKYPSVGVHFRGMSSYMGVGAGYKRSLNVRLDFIDKKQKLYGYTALNLLNSHEDPTYLSTVLYSQIARTYTPAPKANFVKVAINGESWGIYVNAQQFNKKFLVENYKTSKGARWKVRGNPGAQGGLEYTGDNIEDYKRRFQIKSSDDEKSWRALIHLCKTLNQTPADKLEEALRPIVDIDNLLWFLALDVALINGDGYWTRASDYCLFQDDKGKFHFVPHDMNEAFKPPMGPGFGGGGPGGFMMRLPPPGEILPPFLQDMLQLSESQRKKLGELQKDIHAKLDELLTEDQRKQLKDMRERGPGGPGGFGPPPGGPGGKGKGPGGKGMGPGGMGGGVELDPLVGLTNTRTPLRSKVLAVPSLKAQYLHHVRTIADEWLDWKKLGPVVAQYRKLIEKEIEIDTRKLDSFEAFLHTTDADAATGRGREFPLRAFADQRRAFLLNHPEIKKVQ